MNLKFTRLACTIALTGLLLPLSAQEAEKTPSVKIDPTPVKPQAGVITSFAPIVEKVAPSVVQISTSKNMKPGARGQNKMFDDPFFRRFFGLPDGDGDQPDDQPAPQRRGGKREGKEKLEPFGLGSGVVVSAEGHILTNNHVIDGADDILVTLQGDKHEYKAKKIAADSGTDIAVLKLVSAPPHLRPITFGDSDKLRVGDLAIAIGNPFGLTQTVSMGIISSLGRNDLGITAYENFIQTDASINPGNSGGALVDIEGRLVGINQSIYSRTGTNAGIGFAVPANLAHSIMDSLLTKGRVIRGYLGVGIQSLDEALARKLNSPEGTLVNSVEPKGPAEKAGIETGDVITEIDGKKIGGPSELRMTVSSLSPGTKVNVKFLRNGEEKKAEILLAELPANKRSITPAEQPENADPDVLDGVTVGEIDAEARKKFGISEGAKGVVVLEIQEDSTCYAAGLRVGDVIHEIERKPINSANDAVELSEKLKKEKEVLLRVSTKGASRFMVVKEAE
jgi:serine protease Do